MNRGIIFLGINFVILLQSYLKYILFLSFFFIISSFLNKSILKFLYSLNFLDNFFSLSVNMLSNSKLSMCLLSKLIFIGYNSKKKTCSNKISLKPNCLRKNNSLLIFSDITSPVFHNN